MKLSTKLAGLLGSAMCLMIVYTGFFQHINPVKIILLCLVGVPLTSYLGFQLGSILAVPQNRARRLANNKRLKKGSSRVASTKVKHLSVQQAAEGTDPLADSTMENTGSNSLETLAAPVSASSQGSTASE